MTLKVDDILVITRHPLTLVRVIRVDKEIGAVCLSYISKEQSYPIVWFSTKKLEGHKKATRKYWYMVVRLYRTYKKLYP